MMTGVIIISIILGSSYILFLVHLYAISYELGRVVSELRDIESHLRRRNEIERNRND